MIRVIGAAAIVMGLCGFIFYSGTNVTPPATNVCRVVVIPNTTTVVTNSVTIAFSGC